MGQNSYVVQKKIGKGTYATVYKAKGNDNKLYAIKKLSYNQTKNGIPLNIIRELKILKAIRHQNIVPLIDILVGVSSLKVDESLTLDSSPVVSPISPTKPTSVSLGLKADNTNLCLVFDYYPYDLAGIILKKKGALSVADTKCIIFNVLKALSFLHMRCQVIHRDIKPANVMISSEGGVFLGDFGLARQTNEHIKGYTGSVVTSWYRPPELLKGEKKYCSKIDTWALGCVMAEMLKGKPLFRGDSEIKVLKRIQFYFEKESIKKTFEGIEEGVVKLLEDMLQPDVEKRITAAEALKYECFEGVGEKVEVLFGEGHELLVREETKNGRKGKNSK
eukprot:GAHX01002408.1.p1 GENE.GAHX01002408.1~~GAHX01002408.1.p1  ORF type:complete len:333 (-),score=78.59 GAHX01002408.1:459-1457(-)